MFYGVELGLIKKEDVPKIIKLKHRMVMLKAMSMVLCELEYFEKEEVEGKCEDQTRASEGLLPAGWEQLQILIDQDH